MLPVTARVAILIGAFVGLVLPITEKLFPRARPYLPSAMGLLGLLLGIAVAAPKGIAWVRRRRSA